MLRSAGLCREGCPESTSASHLAAVRTTVSMRNTGSHSREMHGASNSALTFRVGRHWPRVRVEMPSAMSRRKPWEPAKLCVTRADNRLPGFGGHSGADVR